MFLNKHASDYVPMHVFKNTVFDNVEDPAVIHLYNPPKGWATIDDCGEWPCTAPENVVLKFSNTQFTGLQTPSSVQQDFQIVSNTNKNKINSDDPTRPSAPSTYGTCVEKTTWNAWHCQNDKIGVLLFESLDGDTWDRSVQPIIITNDNDARNDYVNVVNSMMDHVWDGFYTGQTRLSRFPAQLLADGQDYHIRLTGTPPGNMRYKLIKEDVTGGISVRIPYPNAGAYSVIVDNQIKDYTPWDENISAHGELTKAEGCGENRFVGIKNFLDFYITPGCEVTVQPRDAIMTSVRMEWTLAEFYADGGVVSFTDRVAAALGIHASTIKVVAVFEGSVVVDFFIEAPIDNEPEENA